MTSKDKRKHIRIDSLYPLEVCVSENEIAVNRGMGRTLNISESGILLETPFPIDPNHSLSVTIALQNDLINVKGRVIHCKSGKGGMFETGVRFLEIDKSALQILRKFIRLFREQRS